MGLVTRSMWVLSGPGLEPMSPELAGEFLTTVPPGKPRVKFLVWVFMLNRKTIPGKHGKGFSVGLTATFIPVKIGNI